jgi:hypothetical protein
MSDIDDWEAFRRGRWRWSGYGYESALGNGCGIGDLDGHLERNGHHLFIECKEGVVYRPLPSGQEIALRGLAELPRSTVWLLIGRAQDDDPRVLVELGVNEGFDRLHDWARIERLELEQRRQALRFHFAQWWAGANGSRP